MSAPSDLYPPAPCNVPPGLTTPGARYRLQVLVVLLGILLFFVVYLGLVAGSAYVIYRVFTDPLPGRAAPQTVQVDRHGNYRYQPVRSSGRGSDSDFDIGVRVALALAAGVLFLFLVKGFFKRSQHQKTLDVEITEDEQPRLFEFIRRLCRETGAPLPSRVYVSPEVNAAVFYRTSILNLVWPARKNLLIGLGLVNSLNLTEFKAVLAHEFGHFSQRSLRIGGYVYVSQRIIADLVYGRDALDDLLDAASRIDIRLSLFVWPIMGILWCLRKLLAGMFHVIIFLHAALSRQMEFNADLVAVSVTGSDAPVHVLARLRFAEEALNQACRELTAAADHQIYSADLCYHQGQAADYLRKLAKDPQRGVPPPLPADPREVPYLFQPGEDGIPSMWATHPPNYDRERSAKQTYIRTEFDERSPWLLFDDAEKLRARVSRRFYRRVLKAPEEVELTPAREVQVFIDEDRAEMTYDARYHGLYDGRLIELGDVWGLAKSAALLREGPELAGEHAGLYAGDFEKQAQAHQERVAEYNLLAALTRGPGAPPETEFEFRGQRYRARQAQSLLRQVDGELAADQHWLADLDRRVFQVHYRMARHLDARLAQELLDRYYFHVEVQRLLKGLMDQEPVVSSTLQSISGQRRVAQADFEYVLDVLRQARQCLLDALREADKLIVPPLKNMQAGEPLGPFLLAEHLLPKLPHGTMNLEGSWINQLLSQAAEMTDKLRRIHFKSLGGILALQEKIGREYEERQALPTVKPAP